MQHCWGLYLTLLLWIWYDITHTILLCSAPAGTVTTLLGGNGPGSSNTAPVQFNYPQGLAVGTSGILYVADNSNHVIRAISLLSSKIIDSTLNARK